MPKWLQHIFLFRCFQIKTKLSKEAVAERLRALLAGDGCWGSVWKHRFFLGELRIRHFSFVQGRNSFAPRVWGRIKEQEDGLVVSGVVQMHVLVQLVCWLVLLCLPVTIFVPQGLPILALFYGVSFFAFHKPAKRLVAELENALFVREE